MNNTNIIFIPTKFIQKVSHSTIYNIKAPYKVDDGDWDLGKCADFCDTPIYTSLYDLIVNKKDWKETSLYEYIYKNMKEGAPKWGCDTEEKCIKRGEYLLNLYEDIKTVGSVVTRDLLKHYNLKSRSTYSEYDYIQVAIGRDGQIFFASNGSHRLSIAKILGIPVVPVQVCRRHLEWEKFRNKILEVCSERWGGKTYQKLFHPDLQFITPLHADERYDFVKSNTNLKSGTLLDIGSLFGYNCFRGEMDGFQCSAVETSRTFCNAMLKMKTGLEMNLNIIQKDVLTLENVNYDIIIAFNIFHHFLKTEDVYNRFKILLSSMKYKELFVQFHKTEEAQMKTAFKNYNAEDFAKFLMQSTNKTEYKFITDINGRKLYKIS